MSGEMSSNKNDNILEYYKIAVELHNTESQRYWDRNNVFILINGGFLALLGTDIIIGKIDRLVICCIGAITAYMWILILRQGKDLIERWRKVIHKIENENDSVENVFQTADKLSSEGKPLSILPLSKLPASGIMKCAAIMVCVGWLIAFSGIFFYSEPEVKKNESAIVNSTYNQEKCKSKRITEQAKNDESSSTKNTIIRAEPKLGRRSS